MTTELESIFANAPLAPNAIANPRLREAYARATGKSQAPSTPEASSSSAPKKRMPGEEDDCPICYDGMHNVAEASLTFCEECGNAVHGECFAQCACLLIAWPNIISAVLQLPVEFPLKCPVLILQGNKRLRTRARS